MIKLEDDGRDYSNSLSDTRPKMTRLSDEEIKKRMACAALLPPPGGEVVLEICASHRALAQELEARGKREAPSYDGLEVSEYERRWDEQDDLGKIALFHMACNQIDILKSQLSQAREEIEAADEAIKLSRQAMTHPTGDQQEWKSVCERNALDSIRVYQKLRERKGEK